MDSYLGGTPLDPKVLIADLETAVARGAFYPVLAAAAPTHLGAGELIELDVRRLPGPGRTRDAGADPAGRQRRAAAWRRRRRTVRWSPR